MNAILALYNFPINEVAYICKYIVAIHNIRADNPHG